MIVFILNLGEDVSLVAMPLEIEVSPYYHTESDRT